MSGLHGAVAVVTGGTQGLGAAIARRFADGGAAGIVTCGRNTGKGDAVAEEIIEATGVPIRFVEADLAQVDPARAVIAAAEEAFGRIDVLVNAAGLTDRGGLLDTDPALFDRMIAVNTRAPFFLMQEAARRMVRDGIAGRIVNVGSVSGHAGQPFIAPYCVSKGALATLTRNAAFALMRNRIRVNQLDIGWMASDGEDRIQRAYHGAEDGWQDRAAAGMPFGRLLHPEEVAEAVAFLAGSESGMMTGAVIPFDQSVRGGFAGAAPTPEGALTWPR
jgi:NAD(P)-dependent dehydrogenase (short-subunit alcohol dehydrogenase family)